MLRARINGLGTVGLISDQPVFSSAVPDNAFTRGQNVRAIDGVMRNFGGRDFVTTAPIAPYALFGIQTPQRTTAWIEGGLTAVYAYDGTNHIDITRLAGPYALDEYVDRWTGGAQGTLAALCPGHSGGVQQWTTIDPATRLVDMMYDPQGTVGSQTWQELNYSAYSVRPFESVLVAMNLVRAGTALPGTVQWSEAIAPGATQVDWVARPTNIAGEASLGVTTGNIIDGAPLRNDFIIYKEDSAHRMTLGGPGIFDFQRLPEYVRLINRGCIGIAEEFHVLASRDDIHIFDGNTFRSLLDKRYRRFYADNMMPERLFTTFIAILAKENEAWICFPTKSANPLELKFPDLAIVWNYYDNTFSINEIPQCRDLDQGVIVPNIPDTFDSTSPTDLKFDQDTNRFDQSPFSTALDFMVGAHGTTLSVFAESPTDNGTPRECLAERTGLILVDNKTGIKSVDGVHRIRKVWPYIRTTAPVQVQVGASYEPSGSVIWDPEQTFDPTSDTYIKSRATGKYFSYRIRSNALVNWEATDIEFEFHRVRNR